MQHGKIFGLDPDRQDRALLRRDPNQSATAARGAFLPMTIFAPSLLRSSLLVYRPSVKNILSASVDKHSAGATRESTQVSNIGKMRNQQRIETMLVEKSP